MKKFLVLILSILFSYNIANAENYIFGGAKLFNYGVEKSDLQNVNTSLVNLGFSSSSSSTNNTGIGFDLGAGFGITDNLSAEVGYVNYETLEINTKTTGPVENIKTEITGSGLTFAGKYTDDSGLFVRGGMHSWDLSGKVTTSLGSSSDQAVLLIGRKNRFVAGAALPKILLDGHKRLQNSVLVKWKG
jgi:hypothetical protein